MRTLDELKERISRYSGVRYIYTPEGYIAWQLSTGDNIEVIFIEGRGYGRELYRLAVEQIERDGRPFHSVFTFTKTGNESACRFYEKFGWRRFNLGVSLYQGIGATLFAIPYDELKEKVGL